MAEQSPMPEESMPIISSPEDGPPYTAFVIANPVENPYDETYTGKIIARCKHEHREIRAAYSCSDRLWRQRCPAAHRRHLASILSGNTTEPPDAS